MHKQLYIYFHDRSAAQQYGYARILQNQSFTKLFFFENIYKDGFCLFYCTSGYLIVVAISFRNFESAKINN